MHAALTPVSFALRCACCVAASAADPTAALPPNPPLSPLPPFTPTATPRPGGAGAFTLVFDVVKPEGLVGRLEAGPMRPSQRLLLGRQPGVCDVVLEHASISRWGRKSRSRRGQRRRMGGGGLVGTPACVSCCMPSSARGGRRGGEEGGRGGE